MSLFKIYSSSAGSGKTYTLTREYLQLLLQEERPDYFRQILAITFTNDAAAEMKHRILNDLRAFSSPRFDASAPEWGKFREIAAAINEKEEVADEMLQQRAKQVFSSILQNYTDFSVRTIDSFMNQLVSAFGDELKLPFNYEVVLDKETLLLEAVERLLGLVDSDEPDSARLSEILKQFATEKADEGKSWHALAEELAEFAAHTLNDQYYALVQQLSDLQLRDFQQIGRQIKAFNATYKSTIFALARRGKELLATNGLSPNDFSYSTGGIGNIFERAIEKPFDKITNRSKGQLESRNFYAKAAPASLKHLIDSIADEFVEIAETLAAYIDRNQEKIFLYTLLEPILPKLSLLQRIKKEFDTILEERNQVYIAEFNRKVLDIVLAEPVPFIYERIGEKFNHILIDEFQDTSDLQFFNLLPLIENALAGQHFNLLVGDAKQAIYRWRGGKMELIVHLFNKDIEPLMANPMASVFQQEQFYSILHYLQPEALATNYRSACEIIEFTNDFFTQLVASHAKHYPLFSAVYQSFQQSPRPNAPTGGHVEISVLPQKSSQEDLNNEVLDIIAQVLNDGYTLGDIAVLCRKNSQAAAMASLLLNEGYAVISQDSLLLRSSGAVRLTMAFLKVIDSPDNKLAKYEAAYLFFQYREQYIPDMQLNQAIAAAVEADDVAEFYAFFGQHGYTLHPLELQKTGVFAICEKIMQELRLFELVHEANFLFGLLDVALNFANQQSNHVADFLEYWKAKNEKLSMSAGASQQAITVTTIHKSKGLEYPIVIVPYAFGEIFAKQNTPWYDLSELHFEELCVSTEEGDFKLAASPIRFSKDAVCASLNEQYIADRQANFIEAMNTLYVAFTRPTDKLFILTKHGVKNSINELIFSYLENFNTPIPAEGRVVLYQGKNLRKESSQTNEGVFTLEKITSQDTSDKKLRLRRLSAKLFDLDTFDKSKEVPNKLMQALARVHTVSDIESALKQLVLEGIATKQEVPLLTQHLEELLGRTDLRPLFEEGLKCFNEQEILQKGQAPLRPSRVVFRPEGVYIVEYKTTKPKEADKQQLLNYAKLYRQMGYAPIYLRIVYLATPVLVVDVNES